MIRLVSIYAPADSARERLRLCTALETLQSGPDPLLNDHTYAAGDFNCVENVARDVKRSQELNSAYPNQGGAEFQSLMNGAGLQDEWRSQWPDLFRHTRQDARYGTRTRIDRWYTPEVEGWQHDMGIGNQRWSGLFWPSDHVPVTLRVVSEGASPGSASSGAIRAATLMSLESKKIVYEAWNEFYPEQAVKVPGDSQEPPPPTQEQLTNTEERAKKWERFKDQVAVRILKAEDDRKKQELAEKKKTQRDQNELTNQLDQLDDPWEDPWDDSEADGATANARSELIHSIIKAKTDTDGTKETSKAVKALLASTPGTKDFTASLKKRNKPTVVEKLNVTPDWHNAPDSKQGEVTEPVDVANTFADYYEYLYRMKTTVRLHEQSVMNALSERKLHKEDSKVCEGELTEGEVDETLKTLPERKAAGPDYLPNEFYKLFRHLICKELTAVLNEAFRKGALPMSCLLYTSDAADE